MKFASALLIGLLTSLSLLGTVNATGPVDGSSLCETNITAALNRERFLFEGVLLGRKAARDERAGATRVDQQGIVWMKTGIGRWVSASLQPLTDEQMDQATARDPLAFSPAAPGVEQKGLLQTQQALTSDLLPPLLQSFRALQCRTASLCQAARLAVAPTGGAGGGNIRVAVPGCEEIEVPPLPNCIASPLMSYEDPMELPRFCAAARDELVQFEEGNLLSLGHYDASHRTLRQFAGYLEPFLQFVSFPFVAPLRQVTSFLGQWSAEVPCFLPYCAQKP